MNGPGNSSDGWNANYSQQGSQVTAKDAGYNSTIAPQGNTSIGFQGTWNSSDTNPTPFTANGITLRRCLNRFIHASLNNSQALPL